MTKRLLRRATRRLARVEFCDGCPSLCDARCRSRALREATRLRATTTLVGRG